jgi:nitrogen-specific signal transduction histidine kinase
VSNLPIITVDWVQLQQVVLNLILDALQAIGPAGDGARQVLITASQIEPVDRLANLPPHRRPILTPLRGKQIARDRR